jgi:hypothetical protein
MKKILSLILSIVLCVTLAACSSKQAGTIDEPSESAPPTGSPLPSPSTEPETETDTPTDTPEESEKPDEPLEAMNNAYADALENLLKNNILPDGTKCEPFDNIAQNQFAVYDVDNDGKEELLLLFSTTYSAGMAGYVVAYDETSKELRTELLEFPYLIFYDNGTIKAGWSHNQGRAGDNFWPYSLYQYAPDSDSYVFTGMVDAWDKNYPGAEGEPFPSDIDVSGTGYVYYIMNDKQYDNTHPVDASVYNEWVSTHLGNAAEIDIQYMDLTEENIAQIRSGS